MATEPSGLCPSCGGTLWTDGVQTVCLDCGGDGRMPAGDGPVATLREWYSELCPRCGVDRAVSYGAQYSCGRCGAVWQA